MFEKTHLTHMSPLLPSKELCHYRFYLSLCGVAGLAAERENFSQYAKIFAKTTLYLVCPLLCTALGEERKQDIHPYLSSQLIEPRQTVYGPSSAAITDAALLVFPVYKSEAHFPWQKKYKKKLPTVLPLKIIQLTCLIFLCSFSHFIFLNYRFWPSLLSVHIKSLPFFVSEAIIPCIKTVVQVIQLRKYQVQLHHTSFKGSETPLTRQGFFTLEISKKLSGNDQKSPTAPMGAQLPRTASFPAWRCPSRHLDWELLEGTWFSSTPTPPCGVASCLATSECLNKHVNGKRNKWVNQNKLEAHI